MTKRKSGAAKAVALFAGAAMVLTACGGGGGEQGSTGSSYADCDANPNECNGVPRDQLQQGGEVTYATEKNISNWNLLSSEGNVLDSAIVLKGTQAYTFYTKPDLSIAMNENLLVSAEQTSTSPQTIVYKIKPEAAWSDGTPITAKDFIYNWKVQNGKDCPDCAVASTAGYEQVESIEGSEGGKTVTVTYATPFTDWQQLWSGGSPMYPAHIAAQHGDLNTPEGLAASFEWFGKTVPTWSAGPFKVESFQNNESITLTRNEKYWGPPAKLDRVIFRVITEASQEPVALQNQEVDVIYPQPQVDLVQTVKNIPGVSSYTGLGLSWEHYDLNLENKFLAEEPLRDALFTAVNRQAIIDKTVGQFTNKVKPLNNHNLMPQQEGFQDVVSATGHGSGNIEQAKKVLTDAGYKIQGGQLITPDGEPVPPLRIRYTGGNQIRKDECELFAQQVAPLGVKVQVQPTDDLGGTLDSGDYDIMVYAWVASPFPFANAAQNWTTGSSSNFGGYSNPEVDRLIKEAGTQTDKAAALKKLNEADRLMAEDAYVLPLYQKPTFIAAYNNLGNVRNNSTLDGPTYNIGDWGIKK